MKWWVYKCNSRGGGDWEPFTEGERFEFGTNQYLGDMDDLRQGDKIVAYQSDRNKLVGIAKEL